MAQGYDGFTAMKGRKFIIDDENGQIMSSIIRSFLLGKLLHPHWTQLSPGSSYIFRHEQLRDAHQTHLSKKTDKVISQARSRHYSSHSTSPESSVTSSPQSRKLAFSPSHEKGESEALDVGDLSLNGTPRTRIVNHNWKTIRNAMHVAKNEHMSSVDGYVSH
jgi:5'-nucleotidase